ncbi:hypothetical protein MMC30_002852 [Trapelia coarctata]|nr:hypothetical protein [Trapelia coarctata]
MSCKITVKPVEGPESSWICSWKIVDYGITSDKQFFQSTDVFFDVSSGPAETFISFTDACVFIESSNGVRKELQPADLGHSNAFQFLIECLVATISGGTRGSRAAKLIAPCCEGNTTRSDIIPLRLVDLEYVERVTSFATPLQHFSGQLWDTSADFISLLKQSAGGVLLRDDPLVHDADAALRTLGSELHNRLSFPWVMPGLHRQTIAILEGSQLHPSRGGTGPNIYGAAEALGIDVVVMGVEGHWLQGPGYAHWRKAFVPIQFGFDAEFPARIIAALRQYGKPLDGIFTSFDCYQVAVSAAAKELGLPAEPASAFEVATDKYKMSAFEGHRAFRAANAEEALQIARTEELPYPVIIKPCNGWGSEDVFKVDDAAGLARAVGRLNTDRHGADFVIEHYCDGPEVDVNIVLYDGEILFYEIADEYPKGAENGATQESFHELDTCSPSTLPADEQAVLYNSFLKTLLGLGFRNGIYHCEARMMNSRVEWRRNASGVQELYPRNIAKTSPPSTWVIEVNPRPPGMKATGVVETNYGVDYWGLALIIALRDSQRVRALSEQFRQGAQYHADMVFISAAFDSAKVGIWESGDVTEDLLQRRPDLAKQISRSMTFIKRGDKVPHPSTGVNTFVAYLNIFSRTSRTHLLEVAKAVRDEIKIEYS